jgi:aryl-alcohol dehydrogenase-like predicted oxidoreductase
MVSPLAIGTGTHGWSGSSDQTRKGPHWLVDLFNRAYERGVNFWDLADQYGSHRFARKALRSLDRQTIVINTKTTASAYKECRRDLERFYRELGTDYIDIVLLHAMSSRDWNVSHRGAMDALGEAREEGRIRAVGVSSHSLEALKTAAQEPWLDIILVRLNYDGVNMDGTPSEIVQVLKSAVQAGKGIYAMKVLGCGALVDDLEKALRFVVESRCVHAMTIGFTDFSELNAVMDIVERLYAGQPNV